MMVMNSIAGTDDNDQTTIIDNVRSSYVLQRPKRNIRVGLVKELVEGADVEVSKCIYSALDLFSSSDCKCEETSIKSVEYALASYYTIAMAEASSNLARYDNIRYGFELSPDSYEWNKYVEKARGNFGEEVKRRIIAGSYILSSGYYGKYYLKAQKIRTVLKQELSSLYKKYDVLIAPTMPILPFKFGEKINDPLKIYMIDIDTVIANLTGIPAISVPAGYSSSGLPIGLQIMADELQEQTLFNVASLFESIAKAQRTPDL
jgi:aspartyl-tRNA(Asn)/glutamyl-tRNA(Gln) amidotransferase subunit A